MCAGALNVSDVVLVLVDSPLFVELLLVLREHVFLVLADHSGRGGVHMLCVKGLLVVRSLPTSLRDGQLTWWWWTCRSRSTASAVSVCSWGRTCSLATSEQTSVESGLWEPLRKSLTPWVIADMFEEGVELLLAFWGGQVVCGAKPLEPGAS
jgi:hypothetical protein